MQITNEEIKTTSKYMKKSINPRNKEMQNKTEISSFSYIKHIKGSKDAVRHRLS